MVITARLQGCTTLVHQGSRTPYITFIFICPQILPQLTLVDGIQQHTIKVLLLWLVKSRNSIAVYQSFGTNCFLHLKGRKVNWRRWWNRRCNHVTRMSFFYPEDGDGKFLRRVRKFLPENTVSPPTRH